MIYSSITIFAREKIFAGNRDFSADAIRWEHFFRRYRLGQL